jgi:3-oxoacyl-[acyl-carrier protein] reductase
VKEIQAAGAEAKKFHLDLANISSIRAAFAQIKSAYPDGINIAVLNAGIGAMKTLDECDEETYDKIFNTNTKGTFFAAQESARLIKDGGKMLLLSTAGTRSAAPGCAIYYASKAGVEQFARIFAVELGPRKISVNCLCPGSTDTDMFPDNLKEFCAAGTPYGKRLGTPEDIANAAAGVISAPWITGAVIPVAGGAVVF